jgi:hypothetical protein
MRTVGYSRPFSEKYFVRYGEIYSMAVRPGLVIKGDHSCGGHNSMGFSQIESSLAQKKAKNSVSYKDG